MPADIQAVLAQHANCRHVRYDTLLPMYDNWNRCLEHAGDAQYVCFCHDDDEYEPDFLEQQARFLDDHATAGLVGTDQLLMDETGVVLEQQPVLPLRRIPPVTRGRDFIDFGVRTGVVFLYCPSVMSRRAALGESPFDSSLRLNTGDYITWFRIAESWDIGYIAEKLLRRRSFPGQHSKLDPIDLYWDRRLNFQTYIAEFEGRYPDQSRLTSRWSEAVDALTARGLLAEGVRRATAEPDKVRLITGYLKDIGTASARLYVRMLKLAGYPWLNPLISGPMNLLSRGVQVCRRRVNRLPPPEAGPDH
jgi:glycosyltransferase involved in cell wall biosynthesis